MLNTKKLREIRQAKGLSQASLANKIGIASPHYSNIENGKRGFSTETLAAIVGALDISIEDIWDATDGSNPPGLLAAKQEGIIIEKEKTRFILPGTPETYRLVMKQVADQDMDSDLLVVCDMWRKTDPITKEKILKLLRRNAKN